MFFIPKHIENEVSKGSIPYKLPTQHPLIVFCGREDFLSLC